MISSPIAEQVQMASRPLPESAIPGAYMTDTHHLLQQCQKLLYTVYCDELGWHPNPNAHTQFNIQEEEQLFCDRYDKVAMWAVIIDPCGSEAVACFRVLSPKLLTPNGTNQSMPDLDIIGYSGCPDSLRHWVQTKGVHCAEGQRLAVAKKYRQLCLPQHMFHVCALFASTDSKSPMYDPEMVIVTSSPIYMKKHIMMAGGTQAHEESLNWTILYEEGDPSGPVPIFIVKAATVTASIKCSFQARIKKRRLLISL